MATTLNADYLKMLKLRECGQYFFVLKIRCYLLKRMIVYMFAHYIKIILQLLNIIHMMLKKEKNNQ